ncbi:MAG: hypothetical protein ACTHOH_01900 [Lysobacteraceae bacterium]
MHDRWWRTFLRKWALAGAPLILLSALPAAAQNLIANPGFENNPPTAFGNNIGYSIAPWTLGPGQTSNVVKVDGGVNYNYGNGGPSLDPDPATGAGVQQHYLDIASGANSFYQSFVVPTCGGAAGQTRTATFSGYFSTRDNLAGSGSITIRRGAGLNGVALATLNATMPAPTAPQTSGNAPWVFVSGTVNVTSGTTISYVVDMDNNANFDQAFLSFNSVTCVTSQLTLEKSWSGAAVNDTATLTATRAGSVIDSLASTANTATEVDADATPVTVFQGETVTLAETLGAGNTGVYASALACTGGGTLSGNTLTVGSTGAAIVCRYTNARPPADVSVTKTNTPGVNGNADQAADTVVRGGSVNYAIVVNNAGPNAANGTVLRDPVPTNLTCSSVTCGSATGGAACPAVTIAALQSAGGVTIATLPASSSLTFTMTCTVQ